MNRRTHMDAQPIRDTDQTLFSTRDRLRIGVLAAAFALRPKQDFPSKQSGTALRIEEAADIVELVGELTPETSFPATDPLDVLREGEIKFNKEP